MTEEPSLVEIDLGPGTSQYLLFQLGNERYAIDVKSVREVSALREVDIIPGMPELTMGVMNLEGSLITIYDLKARMGQESIDASKNENTFLIILIVDERFIGVPVDLVSDVCSIVSNELEELSHSDDSTEFIKGIISLSDQRVPVLDPGKIFDHEFLTHLKRVLY